MDSENCTTTLPPLQNGGDERDSSGEMTHLRELITSKTNTVIIAWCVVVFVVVVFIVCVSCLYRRYNKLLLRYKGSAGAEQEQAPVSSHGPPDMEEGPSSGTSHDNSDDSPGQAVSRLYYEVRDPLFPSQPEPQPETTSPSPSQTSTSSVGPKGSFWSLIRGKGRAIGDIALQERSPPVVAGSGSGVSSLSRHESLETRPGPPGLFSSSRNLHHAPGGERPKMMRVFSEPADPSACPLPPPCGIALIWGRRVLPPALPPQNSPLTSRKGLHPLVVSRSKPSGLPSLNEITKLAPSTAPAALTRTKAWSKLKELSGNVQPTARGVNVGEATSPMKDEATSTEKDEATSDERDEATIDGKEYEAMAADGAVSTKSPQPEGQGGDLYDIPALEQFPREKWFQNVDSLPPPLPPSAFALDNSELLLHEDLPPAPPTPHSSPHHFGVSPTVRGEISLYVKVPPPSPMHYTAGEAIGKGSADDADYILSATTARLRGVGSRGPKTEPALLGEDIPQCDSSQCDSGVPELMASPHTSTDSNPDVRATSGDSSGFEDTYTIRIASPPTSFPRRPLPSSFSLSGQTAHTTSQRDNRSGLGLNASRPQQVYANMSSEDQKDVQAERSFNRREFYSIPRQIFRDGQRVTQRTLEGNYDVPRPPSCQPKEKYIYMASPPDDVYVPVMTDQAEQFGVSGNVDFRSASPERGNGKDGSSVVDIPSTPPAGELPGEESTYVVASRVSHSVGDKRGFPSPPPPPPPPSQKSSLDVTTYDVPSCTPQSSNTDNRV